MKELREHLDRFAHEALHNFSVCLVWSVAPLFLVGLLAREGGSRIKERFWPSPPHLYEDEINCVRSILRSLWDQPPTQEVDSKFKQGVQIFKLLEAKDTEALLSLRETDLHDVYRPLLSRIAARPM